MTTTERRRCRPSNARRGATTETATPATGVERIRSVGAMPPTCLYRLSENTGTSTGPIRRGLGVMARRDHEAAVVYLHLNDILIRPESWPDLIYHCLSLIPDEADQLRAHCGRQRNWCGRHHQTALGLESSPSASHLPGGGPRVAVPERVGCPRSRVQLYQRALAAGCVFGARR